MILIYSFPIDGHIKEESSFLLLDRKPIGRINSKKNLQRITMPCYLVSTGTWLEKLFDRIVYAFRRKELRKLYSKKMVQKIKRMQNEKVLQYH